MKNTFSKEDIAFILNLSNEMKTQDNMSTAQPFSILLTTEQKEYRPEGTADDFDIIHDGEDYTLEDFADMVLQYLEDREITSDSGIVILKRDFKRYPSIATVELWLMEYSIEDVFKYETMNYELTQDCTKMNANFFITKKAYNAHIKANGHNLNNPTPYGIHLYRNQEMEDLYKIIHKLADSLGNTNGN